MNVSVAVALANYVVEVKNLLEMPSRGGVWLNFK